MKTKRIIWTATVLMICIGLVGFVAPAQARNINGAPASADQEKGIGELEVSIQRTGQAYTPVTIVLYDENWKALDEVTTRSREYRFADLKAGVYHVGVYAEKEGTNASAEAKVQAARTAAVSLNLDPNAAKPYYSACSGGVSGDGNLLKISSGFGAEVIYMQCGHVVATYGSVGCSCQAGNWAYVNKCTKPKPIYVNLPCPRKRN